MQIWGSNRYSRYRNWEFPYRKWAKMDIIIKAESVDIILRREALAATDESIEPFQERLITIQHEQIGTITDTQLTTGNFFLAHTSFQLTQPIQLIKEVEQEVIQLDFALQGDSLAQPGGKTTQQRFSTGQHNICYLPQAKSVYAYPAATPPLDYTAIIIPKDVYARLIPVGSELYRHLGPLITQQKARFCSAKNLPITPSMEWLIRDMRSSPRTGSLKRLFLESRTMELLLLQLEQMQGTSLVVSSKKADTNKIHEARELLDASYPDSPTIVELAKLVGLNEFNLKRGFKEQMGTTILGYITQRRMEDAKRFLLEGDKSISEISYWVGYKNPAHFTVAFKHYFGMLPSAVRQQGGNS